jgi:hypothetical protein
VFLFGGLLVLVTWVVAAGLLISIGLPFFRRDRRSDPTTLATAAWWGLAIVVVLASALSFFMPLGSPITIGTIVAVALICGLLGWRTFLSHPRPTLRWSRSTAAFAGALTIAVIFLSIAVLGPVTHYDAGLYQWAAVRYATDFPVIHGLANLYGPLGYASAEPVLGAVLSFGPWHDEGYRLINGLFLVLLGWEACTRLLTRPRGVGTAIAVAGVALAYPPLLWMADYWVASPTPDVPVLVLALVAAAYLADLTVSDSGTRTYPLPTIVVLATLMAAFRLTAIPLALALVITAALLQLRGSTRSRNGTPRAQLLAATGITVATAVVIALRDRTLSGWLGYPLGFVPVDVAWRAPDPDGLRQATLGFARDPGNWQEAIEGWGWVGAWFTRLPAQWEPWWLLTALGAGLVLLALPRSGPRRWRPLAASCAPFALAATLWWAASPPALRFGWGPLFALAALALAWGVWRARLVPLLAAVTAVAILVATLATAALKVDWGAARVQNGLLMVVPLPEPPVEEIRLDSGITLRVPQDGDQCWSVYPLCTPQPLPSLRLLDQSFDAGIVS